MAHPDGEFKITIRDGNARLMGEGFYFITPIEFFLKVYDSTYLKSPAQFVWEKMENNTHFSDQDVRIFARMMISISVLFTKKIDIEPTQTDAEQKQLKIKREKDVSRIHNARPELN